MSSEISETRVKVLEETLAILKEQGGRGVRMSDIAKRAGISRQAIYLHFDSRAKLLEAATKHLDEKLDLESRLAPSRAAKTGIERLERYVEFWGTYIPEIVSVAKALLLVLETDDAAGAAWSDRMAAMREGCESVVDALIADGKLASDWDRESAIDTLWTMLLVPNWENLTTQCGWTNQEYVERMKMLTYRILVRNSE